MQFCTYLLTHFNNMLPFPSPSPRNSIFFSRCHISPRQYSHNVVHVDIIECLNKKIYENHRYVQTPLSDIEAPTSQLQWCSSVSTIIAWTWSARGRPEERTRRKPDGPIAYTTYTHTHTLYTYIHICVMQNAPIQIQDIQSQCLLL